VWILFSRNTLGRSGLKNKTCRVRYVYKNRSFYWDGTGDDSRPEFFTEDVNNKAWRSSKKAVYLYAYL